MNGSKVTIPKQILNFTNWLIFGRNGNGNGNGNGHGNGHGQYIRVLPRLEILTQQVNTKLRANTGTIVAEMVPIPTDKRQKLLDFFSMDSNPFVDVVDPAVYLETPQHKKALNKILHSIEDGISMGLLTAQSGMGKTLLVQKIKQALSTDKYETLEIKIEKGLTRTALIKKILFSLGFSKIYKGQNVRVADLLSILSNKIHVNYKETSKRLVILLDDAEYLQVDSLHLLKTISNIEIPEKKLVTIIILGEETILKRIKLKTFKAIAGRMFIKETIKPLSKEEVQKYIQNKLKIANCTLTMFPEEIYEVIHTATGGVCREINNLVYNALVEAFYLQKKVIDCDVLLKCFN